MTRILSDAEEELAYAFQKHGRMNGLSPNKIWRLCRKYPYVPADPNEPIYGINPPWYAKKWWMKTKTFAAFNMETIIDPRDLYTNVQYYSEFYVPWWAWPLELLHRVVFGNIKIDEVKND